MVNPAIVGRSEETMVVWDACLSFLFVFCQVVRHREVTVRYQDLGPEYFARCNPAKTAARLANRIRNLGYQVEIRAAA